MTIQVFKENAYLPVLIYTGLFGFDYSIEDTNDEYWTLVFGSNMTDICAAVEEFEMYAGDYPDEVLYQFSVNASIRLSKAIEDHLDDVAKMYRYSDMQSVRSYTGFDNVFREECIKLATWSTDCWLAAYDIEAQVKSGDIDMPTADELIEMLPVYDPDSDDDSEDE